MRSHNNAIQLQPLSWIASTCIEIVTEKFKVHGHPCMSLIIKSKLPTHGPHPFLKSTAVSSAQCCCIRREKIRTRGDGKPNYFAPLSLTSLMSSSSALCRVISRRHSLRCSVNCSSRFAARSTSPNNVIASERRTRMWSPFLSAGGHVDRVPSRSVARSCSRAIVAGPLRRKLCSSASISARLSARCWECNWRREGTPCSGGKRK